MSGFFDRLYRTVFPEAWWCAVRVNKDDKTCLLNNTEDCFHVMPNTYRYWTADPFLFRHGEKYYVFFEVFDRLKRKGLLGYREILSEKKFGEIHVIYEADYHLSYPFIFEKDGDIYIMPESNKGNELFLLKCISFPDRWEKTRVLADIKVADTTLFTFDGVDYYLTEKVDDSNCFDRLDLYFEQDGDLTECAANPVKSDAATARCAGKVFRLDNEWIRPSQDCGKAYGEKINFNRIISISKEGYSEELITTVSHRDISLDVKHQYAGIHTFNKLEQLEIVDLKSKRQFNLLNFIGIFYKAFRRILRN